MADIFKGNTIQTLLKSPDLILAAFGIIIIIMMIIPLPTFMLDFLMSLSIAFSLTLFAMVLFINSPLELSVFPSLLLILTLFRLALNVSSTRLILLQGPQFNGKLIRAFGNFVVQGNYIVGLIIFIILIAVQFLIISRGTTRIAEVAARFALDSMAGKQISIDSDFAAGVITEEEAKRRKKLLDLETEFYGNMDGATKFISGDVMVGVFITLINSIGGILIGILKFNLSAKSAMDTFILLTVGDGLISQIPSILNATAAGLILTKTAETSSFGSSLFDKIKNNYKPLWIVSIFLFLLALIPGFPKVALILLSVLFGFFAYALTKIKIQEEQKEVEHETVEEEKEEEPSGFRPIDPVILEIGYSLIPLVDEAQGGDLFKRIKNAKNQIAYNYGLIIPPITIRDSLKLEPNEYSIKIHGVEVASWKVYPDLLLAIDPGTATEQIEGEIVEEPTYNLKAIWIKPDDKDRAESFGYTVIDSGTVIITHLTETLVRNIDNLLGREEVKKILDSVNESFPTLVNDVLKEVDYGFIQKVFQQLLKEKVSIRNISIILETIADVSKNIKDVNLVVEYIRERLKNQISKQYVDDNNTLNVYTLDPQLETYLSQEFEKAERTGMFTIEPGFLNKLINQLIEKEKECYQKGFEHFIILTSSKIRRYLSNIIRDVLPKAVVLAVEEVSSIVRVNYLGNIQVTLEKAQN